MSYGMEIYSGTTKILDVPGDSTMFLVKTHNYIAGRVDTFGFGEAFAYMRYFPIQTKTSSGELPTVSISEDANGNSTATVSGGTANSTITFFGY